MNFYDWCVENGRENLLKDWDYEKNYPLTPRDFAKASNRRVWWKCHSCGFEWETAINNRYCGSGCRSCGYRRVSQIKRIPKQGESLAERNPALIKEWHPTKNGKLTPWDVAVKSNKKVWWLGKCGHEWDAVVYGRVAGNGCPYCANLRVLVGYNDLETIFPEIAKEWHQTKNGELTPKTVVAKANKKVWWCCSACGNEWQSIITKRAAGQGCPVCAKGSNISFPEKAIAYYLRKTGMNVLENYRAEWLEAFELDIYLPEHKIAIEYDGYVWHKDTEKDVRKSNLCKLHGVELIRIREDRCPAIGDGTIQFYIPNRNENGLNKAVEFIITTLQQTGKILVECKFDVDVRKDRMPIYGLMEMRKKENSFAQACPDLTVEWNYEKNGAMHPEDVTPFSDKKVWWRCAQHGHEWEAVIKSRTKGSGCPVCAGNKVLTGFNDLATKNPDLSAQWHPTKNHPITAADVTPQSGLKVWWLCSACGYEWESAVYCRNGAQHGCPACARERVQAKLRTPKPGKSLLERAPLLAEQWHPVKNGELGPRNVSLKTHQKVWWLGKCGHEWYAPVYSRSAGNGCPICYAESRKRK